MKAITITKERAEQLLPTVIKESKELSNDAKTVLATLMNYFFSLDAAKENGFIFLNNPTMQKSIRKGSEKIKAAEQELVECNLIRIERGGSKFVGGKRLANRYFINWDNLDKPIKKPSSEELIKQFLEKNKSLETPISSIDIDTEIDKEIDAGIVTDLAIEKVEDKENGKIHLKEKDNLCSSFVKESKTLEELEVKNTLEEQLKEWAKAVNSTGLKDKDDDFELPF